MMSVDSTEIKSVDVLIEKVLKWSYDRRIIQESTAKDQFLKASSEMGELADSILKGDRQGAVDDFGDVLVCLINAAEIMKIPLQEALEHAYNEIKDRKGVMFQGAFVKQTDENYPRIMKALGIEEGGHE